MKKNLKLKERLGAFFLALLFVLQAVLSLLPVASGSVVHAAVNSIGTWKDEEMIDYDYRFNMKYQPGVTSYETFGCDNKDREAFSDHGRSDRDAETVRVSENYKPGSAGIRYNNIGRDAAGNIVDVRLTLMGVQNAEERYDIRTPINGICGMIDVADHYADNMEKQTECRAKIKEASHLLLELINEVLDMSKLESDEVVLEEIPFNLNSISEEILGVIEHMAAEQNIRILWEKKEVTHWNLIGSPVHVKRILMNILSNAVKYNKENGYVYISCREIPSKQTAMTTLEFVCRDTGIGMAEAFQKRIFEPFAQEHAGSRTKFAGTGLGMPITKKLVEKMGGTISFESKEGTGTTFVIRIPFRIDTDMKDRTETEEKTENPSKITKIRGYHVDKHGSHVLL